MTEQDPAEVAVDYQRYLDAERVIAEYYERHAKDPDWVDATWDWDHPVKVEVRRPVGALIKVRLPGEKAERFRQIAERIGSQTSYIDLVDQAMDEFLERHG